MEETALKFGPEWIRALTQTNGVSAPAQTSAATKYKLANYRYGREEMLAMFDQNVPMPESLREFQQLAVENTQPPLALVTMTEEEQRVWARSVNSDAVLRLTVGKGAVPGAGPGRGARGGSVDRGRGRGRGSGYQRGIGDDEGQFGAFIRPRPFERSHSLSERDQRWDERDKKPDRPFAGRAGYDGDAFRKENAPAGSGGGGSAAGPAASARASDNWRAPPPGHAEDDDNWRSGRAHQQPEKWKSWRNHNKGDGDDDAPPVVSNGPLKKDQGRHWLEEHGGGGGGHSEQLPEWIQDQGDTEKVGCFDAKGAFLDTKDSEDETWDSDFLPISPSRQEAARPLPKREERQPKEPSGVVGLSGEPPVEKPKSPPVPVPVPSPPRKAEISPASSPPKPIPPAPTLQPAAQVEMKSSEEDASKVVSTSPKDDSFAHLAKAAENMMAEWTAEEEKKFVSQSATGELPLPEHLYRWLYKDPQGEIQGPFSSAEMLEWFQAGYFTMDLMVKRVCDAAFTKLGTLIKSWNMVPFLATQQQQPPPVKVPLGTELGAPSALGLGGLPHPGLPSLPPGQMNYALQQHYMQEVYRVAAMQQIQNSLKTNEAFASLSPMDQNRICLQYYMASHSMSRPAGFGDAAPIMNLLSSMGPPPMFGLPPSHVKDPQTEANWPPQQPVTTASATSTAESRGTSVWDADSSIVSASLPMPAAAPSRNLMETFWQQQLASQTLLAEQMRAKEEEERRAQELQKLARLEEERRLLEERRLVEERLKEEEEQKRRQQEAEEALRKEEEERRKREEEERRKREEEEERQRALEEQKRKLEEQERQQEEQRRLEEELALQRRIEEERKQAIEMEKKRKEEERKAEEARKAAEERKRQEKAAKQAAAAASAAMAQAAMVVPPPPAAAAPPPKKSTGKVCVIDADEFMALKQPPKQPQPKVEPPKPEKPQGPVWGGKASQPASSSALSLAEIQRVQEEKERNLAAERLQQQRKQQQAMQQAMLQHQQQQQQKATLTWASRAQAPAATGSVKSLSEIQQEEADKMKKAQQQQRQQQQTLRQQESSVLQLAGAWGSSSNSLLKSFNNSFQYLDLVPDEDPTRGFWDDAATSVPTPAKPKAAAAAAKPGTSYPSLGGGGAASSGRSSKSHPSKKAEEQVMKLFEEHAKAAPTDELTAWCVQRLGGLQSYLDIPTVVAILKDVESPAEVHEYVQNFFGSSQDTADFARQFLQKREQYHKAGDQSDEAFVVPMRSAAASSGGAAAAANQTDGFTAARSKKKKKKMQKVDNSLLGFTVQADPTRLNAGEIDRIEGL